MKKQRIIPSWFSSNSEASASELLENMSSRYYMDSDVISSGSYLQSHTGVLPVTKYYLAWGVHYGVVADLFRIHHYACSTEDTLEAYASEFLENLKTWFLGTASESCRADCSTHN